MAYFLQLSLPVFLLLGTNSILLAAEARRPNVIIVLADDLGYGDIGVHGASDIPTPHIDRIAAEGVRCTNAYSAHPFCSPMRASLMAGRYQQRFGYERNIAYDPQNRHMGLPTNERTIARRLHDSGYVTGILGKWHLGAAKDFHPQHRGFDFFYGFRGGGHNYFEVDLLRPVGEGYYAPIERDGKPADLTDYLTTEISREAVSFVEANRRKPFFLYVAYNAPHTPMQAPDEKLSAFLAIENVKRRTYAAMVSVMDDGIGQLLAALDRLKLRRDTLVFFLSDNGGPENANASDNGPLRGQKGDVLEGGIRVPFLASWIGKLPAGAVYNEPVNSIDIARTAVAIGRAADDKPKLEGANLIPLLSGNEPADHGRALFWRKENGAAWAVRAGNLKLLKRSLKTAPELYDLHSDIGETNDLAAVRQEDVHRLTALYEAWNQHNQPPFFPGFREYHPTMDRNYIQLMSSEN